MPILNYTTKIEVTKTVGEIQEILGRAGVQAVSIEYKDRVPVAVFFQLDLQGRRASFRLPARYQGVYNTLRSDTAIERRYKDEAQARRVAWRIIKDWVEAQLALIEAGAAELSEVFLPYLVRPDTGQTLFEEFKAGHLLPAGQIIEEG